MSDKEAIFGSFKKEHYTWNVLNEQEFKDRYMYVFNNVAKILAKTFGPYGAPSIIKDTMGTTMTKDGWNVLKRIQFNDMILNTILESLVSICSPVVTSSGDGSTTCIIAADALLDEYMMYKENSLNLYNTLVRSKDFLNTFSKIVNELIELIESKAKLIDENNLDKIYKLALTSSNYDEEISNIVYKIYQEGSGPNIDFIEAKGNKTSYEIIKGFRADISYIDKSFINAPNATCEIDRPILLMFDHTVEYKDHRALLDRAKEYAMQEGRRLVVIADYFEKNILNYIQRQVYEDLSLNRQPFVVYCKASMPNGFKRQEYSDFSSFTGGRIIGTNEMYKTNEETGYHEVNPDIDVREYFGRVEKIVIGKSNSTICGFTNRKEEVYMKHVNDAKQELQEEYDKIEKGMGVQLIRLQQLKQRCIKLSGKLAMIYVGGSNPMEKKVNYDAVEDVVKACESAYKYGYNIGGSLIIPICAEELRKKYVSQIPDEGRREYIQELLELDIIEIIDNAFRRVFSTVLSNKDGNLTVSNENISQTEIIAHCVKNKVCYDLIKEEYTEDIINPTKTDTEILRATSSIINSLMSSNQFISVGVNSEI